MNYTAQQRTCSTELLDAIVNEERFLDRLNALYRHISCGTDLPFEHIRAYWRGESSLTRSWRRALGQQAFNHSPGNWYFCGSREELITTAHRWMFTSNAGADWIKVSERLITLCCPFFNLHSLSSWFVAKPAYTSRTMPKSTYLDRLLEALTPWSQALAEGRGEWAEFHAQLVAVGADPALLHTLLSKADPHRLNVDLNGEATGELSMLIAYFTIMRLILVDTENVASVMAQRFPELANSRGIHSRGALWLRDEWYALLENYHRPLNLALARHGDLRALPKSTLLHRFSDWCNGIGLIEVWMDSSDRFRDWLMNLPEEFRLDWLSDTVQQRHPKAALVFEQVRFAKSGRCPGQLNTAEALKWYRSILGQLRPDDFKNVIRRISEYADDAQRLDLICRHVSSSEQCDYSMLRGISDAPALLRLLNEHPVDELRRYAACELNRLAWLTEDGMDSSRRSKLRHPEIWPLLRQACETHSHILADALSNSDAELWQIVWDNASLSPPTEGEQPTSRHHRHGSGDARDTLISKFLSELRYNKKMDEELFALAATWYQSDASRFHAILADSYSNDFKSMIQSIGRYPDSPLMELVPELAARTLSQGSGWFYRKEHSVDGDIVDLALCLFPEKFDELDNKQCSKLLQTMGPEALLACRETLAKLFASKQKAIRIPALEFLARTSPAIIRESGLLNSRNAKTRQLVLTGLALNPAAEALPLIREYIDDNAHDQASRDLSLDALERGGESIAEFDAWSSLTLKDLQGQAQNQKVPAAVRKQWSADIAQLLSPLGEPLAQYLLMVLAEDDDEHLPRRARKILGFLNSGARADFALYGVNQWIAGNGAADLAWWTRAVADYADERVVNELVKAVKAWKKKRKVKANDAIRLIGRVPGIFGLAQVRELWESRSFSPSIIDNCRQTLEAAAAKRGLPLQDFLDQLVPDFGLTREGLVLDVGPWTYTAKIGPDLNLAVVGPEGKTTKSLPKAKAEEDADKRSQAEIQFKALQKNLKPVLSQQGERLTEALHVGKIFPQNHWQRMFLEHPLLSIIGSRIVFNALDNEGQILLQLRPTDSGELLDINDDEVQLSEATTGLRICHPLDLDTETCTAWREHFKDYHIPSPIGQWDAPILQPNADEVKEDRILRHDGQVLSHARLASLLKKWGYKKGAAGDGARISEHTLKLDRGNWLITLNHGGMSVFFDANEPVTLESFDVRCWTINNPERQDDDDEESWWRKKVLGLKELPPGVLALLLSQAQALKDAAEQA